MHLSVVQSLNRIALTNGERKSILDAVDLLQSRLNALPSMSSLEVALVMQGEGLQPRNEEMYWAGLGSATELVPEIR